MKRVRDNVAVLVDAGPPRSAADEGGSGTARTLTWAGGTHHFDLNRRWCITRLEVLGDTLAARLARFESARHSVRDVEEVIEIALIGGGLGAREARDLVARHVIGKPLGPNALVAHEILATVFVGVPNGAGA